MVRRVTKPISPGERLDAFLDVVRQLPQAWSDPRVHADQRYLAGLSYIPILPKQMPTFVASKITYRIWADTTADLRWAIDNQKKELLALDWGVYPKDPLHGNRRAVLEQLATGDALMDHPCAKFPSFYAFADRVLEDRAIEGEMCAENCYTAGGQIASSWPMPPEFIRLVPWGADGKIPSPFAVEWVFPGGMPWQPPTADNMTNGPQFKYHELAFYAIRPGYDGRGLSPIAPIAEVVQRLRDVDAMNGYQFSDAGKYTLNAMVAPNMYGDQKITTEDAVNTGRNQPDYVEIMAGLPFEGAYMLKLREDNRKMQMIEYRQDQVRQIYNAFDRTMEQGGFVGRSNLSEGRVNAEYSRMQSKGVALQFADFVTEQIFGKAGLDRIKLWAPELDELSPVDAANIRAIELGGKAVKTRNEGRRELGLTPMYPEWDREDIEGVLPDGSLVGATGPNVSGKATARPAAEAESKGDTPGPSKSMRPKVGATAKSRTTGFTAFRGLRSYAQQEVPSNGVHH
jgi:hypothetical protein